ncbi:MAG: tetratricopeptide repeat protein [Myxococcota bacterium]
MIESDTPTGACPHPRTSPLVRVLRATVVASAIYLLLFFLPGCSEETVSLEEIRALQSRGAFAQTLEPLRERLSEQPDDPELNFLYGGALLQTGSPDRAIWAMRKAARDPRWAEAAGLQLGSAALATREWANAIEIASEILGANPDSTAALLIRGNARLEEKSNYEAALADFERLIELQPTNVDAQASRVAALIAVGRVDDAARALDVLSDSEDTRSAPASVRARICTVTALFASERKLEEEAERRFSDCLEAHPRSNAVLEEYVAFLDTQRRGAEANDLLHSAVERSPGDSALRIGLARRLILSERFDESRALLEEGTRQGDPAVASDAWATLGDHYVALHELSAAADAYRQALALVQAPTVHQQLTLGDILARANRNEEALAVAREIDNDVYRGLIEARVHINQGEPKAALSRLDEILPRWPNNPGARYWAARAAEQIGRFDRAVEEYRQSIRSGAGFSDAGVRLARLHLAENAYEDAWNALSRFLDERPNDPQAARLLMRIATVTGPDTRLRALTQKLTTRPSWPEAVSERARTLAALTQPERGLDTVRVVSGLDLERPANGEALRTLVDLLIGLERGVEALGLVESGLKKAPDAARFHELRGRVLLALARNDEAYEATSRAIEIAPRDARSLAAHGLALLARNALEPALDHFARARRFDSGLVEAYTEPGRALAGNPARVDEALELWRALLIERPEHTGAALTLARAELGRGRRGGTAASEALARAFALAERAERFGAGREALEVQLEVLETQGATRRAVDLRARLDEAETPTSAGDGG